MKRTATLRWADSTHAAEIVDDSAHLLDVEDVGALLRAGGRAARTGVVVPLAEADYAPLVLRPSKIFCVGLNYSEHVAETRNTRTEHPALFTKFPASLIGANDPILLPPESDSVDWEAELCVIVGQRARRVTTEAARDAIAGYAVMNDISMRDWQTRTSQWTQGKTWEKSTPLGPWLGAPEPGEEPHWRMQCEVDGVLKQDVNTAELIFDPYDLVAYVSTFVTLEPGDVIATGTPGGVGYRAGELLRPGNVVSTRIEGLGECRNLCVAEPV